MTGLWTAQGIKIDELDAYLLSCNDKLNLEVKCREFVRLVSSVILTPVVNTHSAIILMKAEQKRKEVSGGVQTALVQKLKEHGFEVGINIEASYEILTNCCNFTVISRLSPKWNPVGPWLVQGADFLSHDNGHALRFDLNTSSQETSLFLNVQNIKLLPIQIGDLDVSTVTLNNFKTHYTTITEYSICSNQCFILPNLLEAYIYSVSHQIPSSCGVSTYDMIRLEWKKKHGIILPEKPGLYYQVYFTHNPQNIMTYPEYCVYKVQPMLYPCREADTVLSAFISDISARLPLVCGQIVSFSPASVPSTSLYCAATLQSQKNGTDLNIQHAKLGTLGNSSEINCASQSTPQLKDTTLFECPDVQKKKSTDTMNNNALVEVKKLFSIEECKIETCSEQNSKVQTVEDYPMTVSKHQGGTSKTFQPQPSEDQKTNAAKDMEKKILRTKVSVLKEWLHNNGIKFHSADKKETLVKLVLIHALKTGTYM